MIAVEHLVFDYPGQRALDDVTFALVPGSITALVGPNGAGKTTLLRCIAALETPFAGRVLLDGVDVFAHPRDCHRRMGYQSDFFGLYDELTVAQCLRHRAAIHALPSDQGKLAADWAAAQCGLADRLDQKAGALSRGLRQRLAVAQAIIHKPAALLLDEPASGLDPEARHELSVLLLGLRDEGITILVSSHILAELEDYSSHLLMLREGRVVEHRALAAGAAEGRALISLRLARSEPRLAEILGALDGVHAPRVSAAGAEFGFDPAPEARARLLRVLVEAGLAVTDFAVKKENLQDAYLARLGGEPPR